MARTTHVLAQLDPARRTAVCAVHGPVRIRRRMRLGSWHCELELREAREAKRWQRNAGAERLARALNRSPGPELPSTGTNSQNHRWTNDTASLPPCHAGTTALGQAGSNGAVPAATPPSCHGVAGAPSVVGAARTRCRCSQPAANLTCLDQTGP
jgi:hypothetical protein